ncbi:hypothetical protein [Salegentibacter mishustinae]|uniref:hypothetical protein n=1 Tax=Salegentibacter mishustinae TaxID=270918 RepID=UPI002491B307|nr:hypothetical protein [Salegentibacter mishustinae]
MAINIYKENFESIEYISENNWDLPTQIYELEIWLEKNQKKLQKGKYVADIGFEMRKDANGGGAVLNSKIIKMLNDVGMEIYFSEYKTEKKE